MGLEGENWSEAMSRTGTLTCIFVHVFFSFLFSFFLDICFHALCHANGRSPDSLPLLFCALILRDTLLLDVFSCFSGFSQKSVKAHLITSSDHQIWTNE